MKNVCYVCNRFFHNSIKLKVNKDWLGDVVMTSPDFLYKLPVTLMKGNYMLFNMF